MRHVAVNRLIHNTESDAIFRAINPKTGIGEDAYVHMDHSILA